MTDREEERAALIHPFVLRSNKIAEFFIFKWMLFNELSHFTGLLRDILYERKYTGDSETYIQKCIRPKLDF